MSPDRHPGVERGVGVLEDDLDLAGAAPAAAARRARRCPRPVEAGGPGGRLAPAAAAAWPAVDLPQPDSPTSAERLAPVRARSETPSTACTAPICLPQHDALGEREVLDQARGPRGSAHGRPAHARRTPGLADPVAGRWQDGCRGDRPDRRHERWQPRRRRCRVRVGAAGVEGAARGDAGQARRRARDRGRSRCALLGRPGGSSAAGPRCTGGRAAGRCRRPGRSRRSGRRT